MSGKRKPPDDHKEKNMKTLMTIARLGAICASFMIAPAAHSDGIERSCRAYYSFHLSSLNNEQGQWLVAIGDIAGAGTENGFTARRGCGQLVPNRCRQRASEALMACMKAHAKNPAQVPDECRSNGVQNYPVDNLGELVRTKACEYVRTKGKVNPTFLPPKYSVKTTIKGQISGDDGCGVGNPHVATVDLAPLEVQCP